MSSRTRKLRSAKHRGGPGSALRLSSKTAAGPRLLRLYAARQLASDALDAESISAVSPFAPSENCSEGRPSTALRAVAWRVPGTSSVVPAPESGVKSGPPDIPLPFRCEIALFPAATHPAVRGEDGHWFGSSPTPVARPGRARRNARRSAATDRSQRACGCALDDSRSRKAPNGAWLRVGLTGTATRETGRLSGLLLDGQRVRTGAHPHHERERQSRARN